MYKNSSIVLNISNPNTKLVATHLFDDGNLENDLRSWFTRWLSELCDITTVHAYSGGCFCNLPFFWGIVARSLRDIIIRHSDQPTPDSNRFFWELNCATFSLNSFKPEDSVLISIDTYKNAITLGSHTISFANLIK